MYLFVRLSNLRDWKQLHKTQEWEKGSKCIIPCITTKTIINTNKPKSNNNIAIILIIACRDLSGVLYPTIIMGGALGGH